MSEENKKHSVHRKKSINAKSHDYVLDLWGGQEREFTMIMDLNEIHNFNSDYIKDTTHSLFITHAVFPQSGSE